MRIIKNATIAFLFGTFASIIASPCPAQVQEDSNRAKTLDRNVINKVQLSKEHHKAVNRCRRIIDLGGLIEPWGDGPKRWIDWRFSLLDKPAGTHVDSLWWCIDEGNIAYYPSKVLPVKKIPPLKPWREAKLDLLEVMVEETHKRGLEAFFAYRLNGYDRDSKDKPYEQPMKLKHPEWLIQGEGAWCPGGLWNFTVPGVHDFKVRILQEVAENYDFDGIFIDFARHPPCLPVGLQWEHRDAMTDFIRKLRLMLQQVAAKRKRPYLLSVRVPSTVPGCHYDGIDIETWARQNLVDIIVMGCRSIDVDVAGFRQATAGSNIKLYPSMDDAHSPDGYRHPPIDFFRGVCANWWQQGVDGILTFNLYSATPEAAAAVSPHEHSHSAVHQQVFCEVGDPEAIRFKDKMFVVQRRYGAGWEDRWNSYHNNNSQAPLPTTLSGRDRPVILTVYVADDLAGNAMRVKSVKLRVLLSGKDAENLLDIKLNGVLLTYSGYDGWQNFKPIPRQFAVGRNLVSIRLKKPARDSKKPVIIEKLEVHVTYNQIPPEK